MSKYRPERIWPRLIPTGSVMVSIYGPDGQHAYGVISNIAEGGAQCVSGVLFESGSRVLLRIGFDPEEPFSAQGEVVWCRDDSDAKHKSSYIHGVRFHIADEEQKQRLREILERPDFRQPVVPGAPATATGLDTMMTDLSDELGKLGEKIGDEG